MPIDYYGFLGKDIEESEKEVSVKHKEVFAFFEEFNHFLQKMKFDLKVDLSDERKITIGALFIKSLETFQSIYILVRNCLSVDAENQTRVLFEEMVQIGYCCIGEEEFKRYMGIHLHDVLKMINAARNNPSEFPRELFQIKSYEERKKEINTLFARQGNPRKISIEGMARKLSIIQFYNSYYRTVSIEVHTRPKSLEKYLIANRDGKVEGFYWGPRPDIMPLFTTIDLMFRICKFLSGPFGVPAQKDILSFEKKVDELFGRHSTECM